MKNFFYLVLILIVGTFITTSGCVQRDYTVTVKGMVIDAAKQVGVSGVPVNAVSILLQPMPMVNTFSGCPPEVLTSCLMLRGIDVRVTGL